MPDQIDPNTVLSPAQGVLYGRSKLYRPDATLDRIADLYDNDREAWERMPASVKDHSILHRDMRNDYRAAVDAGLIPDNRPAA